MQAFDRVVTGAEEIDHVAVVAKLRRLLNDQHRMSVAFQAQRQCQTSDSGAADEHLHVAESPLRLMPDVSSTSSLES